MTRSDFDRHAPRTSCSAAQSKAGQRSSAHVQPPALSQASTERARAEKISEYEAGRRALLVRLREIRTAEARYAAAEAADTLVKRCYWKAGGVRFLSEALLRRLDALDPAADVPTMRIDLYNSMIAPIRRDLEALLTRRAELADPDIPDERSILEGLNLQPVNMRVAPAVLTSAIEHNLSTLKRACAGVPMGSYVPRQQTLLDDLLALYEGADALLLCPDAPDEPDPAACRAAMARLKSGVRDLLNKHSLPI